MNKYKIIALVLSVALISSLVRLVFIIKNQQTTEPRPCLSQIVFDNILARKSVRSFTNQVVSNEQIDTLLQAAMAAPTGRDMRPWKFVVVTDTTLKNRLTTELPYAKMLAEAPIAIVVCGDMSVTDAQGKSSANWTFDCSAATENLLLAAEAMGLGAVWTGVYPYEDRLETVSTLLKLPKHIIPLNVIPIGYPKGQTQTKNKYNKNNIIYNTWVSQE